MMMDCQWKREKKNSQSVGEKRKSPSVVEKKKSQSDCLSDQQVMRRVRVYLERKGKMVPRNGVNRNVRWTVKSQKAQPLGEEELGTVSSKR